MADTSIIGNFKVWTDTRDYAKPDVEAVVGLVTTEDGKIEVGVAHGKSAYYITVRKADLERALGYIDGVLASESKE